MPPYTAIALPRSPGAKLSVTMAALAGCMIAANTPWAILPVTSCHGSCATPHPIDASMNPIMPTMNALGLPMMSPMRPPSARQEAIASR